MGRPLRKVVDVRTIQDNIVIMRMKKAFYLNQMLNVPLIDSLELNKHPYFL